MRKLSTIYPGKIIIDANNPDGTFKNEVTPGVSGDGTPLEEQWQQDAWGFFAHIMDKGGLTPDGVQENEATSQIYDALEIAIRTLMPASQTSKGTAFLDDEIISTNSGGDVTNDIDFSGGRFDFDDGTGQALVGALTKQLDVNFVAGNNQGGLDTGAIADDTYHCFAIHNPSTGISDYLFSLSPTAPTLPAGFTKQQRVWSTVRLAGAIRLFIPEDNYCYWTTEVESFDGDLDASEQVITVDTPTGITTLALLNAFTIITAGSTLINYRYYPTSANDDAVTRINSQVTAQIGAGFNAPGKSAFEVVADTLAQIKAKASANSANETELGTRGYIDINLKRG